MKRATRNLSAALAAMVTVPLMAATGSQDTTTDPKPEDSPFIYRDLADDAPAPAEDLPETTTSALTTASSELQPAPASDDDTGIYTPEMDTADELLADAVGNYPDVFGGHYIDDSQSWFGVWVADPDATAYHDLVDDLAAGGASHLVVFHDAEYSLTELESASDTISLTSQNDDTGIVGIGISGRHNGVSLVIEESMDVIVNGAPAEEVVQDTLSDEAYAEVLDLDVGTILIDFDEGSSANGSQSADSGSKSGGAALNWPGSSCSYGLPVTVNGTRFGLTAGHCLIGGAVAFAPNRAGQAAFSFGTTATTSWRANANRYGDFRTLTGASYATSIWTSPTKTKPITRTQINPRAEGQQVCASGRSKIKCRYYVRDRGARVTLTDRATGVRTEVKPVMRLRYRPNRTADSCAGWVRGDSGGAIYFTDTKYSGVIATGLITGSTRVCPSNGSRNYWATELRGICSWAKVSGRQVSFPHAPGNNPVSRKC